MTRRSKKSVLSMINPQFPFLAFLSHNTKRSRPLSCGDGLADSETTLPGVQVSGFTADNCLGFLDNFFAFGENEFDVAGVRHVWVDTTVGTVSSAALLRCLVDLDVLNDQVTGIESLGIGICLCVLQKTEELLSRLDWPSSTSDTECLSLSSATGSTSISSHWDGFLVFLDILEEFYCTAKLPAIDCLGGFTGILERNS